ncbi:MAG: 1-acyl-sn-glycerol-3-phosphate acyltransferase [Crocinitomicaceae bacterium]|nr:1-acyl-sn-glycerol-3-phosphate acyltransferase [Crocinitomicaceae bacterium]
MDPLVVAALRRPIVFFMTRSDVFTTISKPFLWACQMLPIYRQHDGEDTKKKNEQVFQKCTNILKYGRNLLIFGEGFTDDTFIRRLKPVKKGAVRIGFITLEAMNWKKNVYIAAVGCNYSNPNQMLSDILISTSEKICLNDYREAYKENPSKTITDLTKLVEKLMQEQITHVMKKENAPMHENIMMLTRKGITPDNFDRSRSLVDRWKYSQKLANWLNDQEVTEDNNLGRFKSSSDNYFKLLKRFKLEERLIHWKLSNRNGSRAKEILTIIALFPLAILGLIHCGIPYFFIKRFVEKSFRRKVFWGSVKLILGKLTIGLLNIPVIFAFYYFVYPNWWVSILYYLLIGIFGLAAYISMLKIRDFKKKGIINKTDLSKFIKKREALIEQMKNVVPTEFH